MFTQIIIKIMKKTIAILAAALVSVAAFAQTGIGAGYANSTLKSGNSSTAYDGAYVALYASVPLAGPVGIKTGVVGEYLMSNKSNSIFGISGELKSTEVYVDVPVQATFGGNISKDLAWNVYAGPTASLGVVSQYKASTNLTDKTATVDNYGDNSNYGRFDVLVGGGVMIDFASKLRFDAGYDLGLLNRNTADSGNKTSRSLLHVGVAFLF